MRSNLMKYTILATVFLSVSAYADDSVETRVDGINDNISNIMTSLKSSHEEVSLFSKTGDGYLRIFSSMEALRGKMLPDRISQDLIKDGKYQAKNIDIGGKHCDEVFYKTYQNGNYAIFIGKNCQ